MRLLYVPESDTHETERMALVQEAFELTKIFASIVHGREGTRIKTEIDENKDIKENDFSRE